MVNHLRTLLLNRGHSEVKTAIDWYIDPSFEPVKLDGHLLKCYKYLGLMEGVPTASRIIEFLMPFLLSVDLASLRAVFDPRSTVLQDTKDFSPSGVTSFFKTVHLTDFADSSFDFLNLNDVVYLFDHTGDQQLDTALDIAKTIVNTATETEKRFGALVFAMLIQMEHLRQISA